MLKQKNKKKIRQASQTGSQKKLRAWYFEEVPVGSIIEYEESSWTGFTALRRDMITGVSQSGETVSVHFGDDSVNAETLASDPKYKLIRDEQRFPCAVIISGYDKLSNKEKLKAAKLYASIICATSFFTREFISDTLDPDAWLDASKEHNVLVDHTGHIRYIWHAAHEKDPEFSIQEMCDSAGVISAYHYVMERLNLLSKVKAYDLDLKKTRMQESFEEID